MQKSPYKFLDSYSKEDRDIFFGRDKEIEELYSRVFESRILIVYGTSGTGKSSLINCGLANKFNDADWLPVTIRRDSNINRSLYENLEKAGLTSDPQENRSDNIVKVIKSLYLDHFKPVYLIFDQFEELFIFGDREEKNELVANIKKVLDSDLQCRMIFSIREEYLAGITEFEREIPTVLSNRIRIEKMTRQNAIKVIEGPCHLNNISVEEGFPEMLLEKLNPETTEIELTWLQVYLDKVFHIAAGSDGVVKKITKDLLDRAGEVKDLLGSFLEEQISRLDDPESGQVVLKSFVSVKGTKLPLTAEEVIDNSKSFGKELGSGMVKDLIQTFIRLRILRDKDENARYELRHDSLAGRIYEMITMVEKELLEIRQFLDHAYNSYEKRGLFLSAEDLSYIAPYEDKLFLNEKFSRFISQSRWSLQKTRRRRQRALISTAVIIIAVLSFFTLWALRERRNAIAQGKLAIEQSQIAEEKRMAADSAYRAAEQAREEAVASGKLALQQKEIADDQRRRAENSAIEAEEQRNIASVQRDSAKNAGERADKNAERAEDERIEAERLRMLSLGKALSIKSMQLQGQKELQTLLAYQAYLFNKDNRGNTNDADIYLGLYNVAKQYGSAYYKIYKGHTGEIKSIAFIPGSNEFFTSGFDGRLLKGDIYSETQDMQVISPGPEIIEVLAVSPDNKWLACGGRNSIIKMIPVTDGDAIQYELKGHENQINSLVFSNEGKYLWSASLDGKILRWDVADKSFTVFETGKPEIILIDVASTNNYIAGVSSEGIAFVWDTRDVNNYFTIEIPGKSIRSIKFNPDGNLLAAGYSDGYFELWDISARKIIKGTQAHSAGINAISFNSKLSQIATAGNDKAVKIWDINDLTMPPVIFNDNGDYVMAAEFSPDGQMIVSGTYDGSANLTGRATNAMLLSEDIRARITRDLNKEEWSLYIGRDVEYEKAVLK